MERSKILIFGVLTRLALFISQAILTNVTPDWRDPSNFNPPRNLSSRPLEHVAGLPLDHVAGLPLDHVVGRLVDGYYTWDAVHVLTVSRYGYIYEKELAFYPFYPITVKMVTELLPRGFVGDHYLYLCCGLAINFVMFLVSVDRIYLLTNHLFNKSVARITAVLFCISPATIHLTAPYTEMLYFTLTLHGLYLLEVHSSSTAAALVFGLSAVTRSNGMINFGFIAYHLLWPEIRKQRIGLQIGSLVTVLTKLILNFVIFITPFIVYAQHAYNRYCEESWTPDDFPKHMVDYSRSQARGECRLPCDGKPTWCSYTIPISYSYIQTHYWKVGLMKYYRLAKVPCFVLAGPVLALTAGAVMDYYRRNRAFCLSLGLGRADKDPGCASPRMFVYVVHLAVVAGMATPFIHIEVLTRFLFSATPYLYWYSAQLMTSHRPRMTSPLALLTSLRHTAVVRYYVAYTVTGTAAFVSGLPWT